MIGEGRITREFVAHGRVDDCPVIDTHAHFGPYVAIYFPRHQPERVRTLDGCNVRWLIMVDTRLWWIRSAAIVRLPRWSPLTLIASAVTG